MNKISFMNSSRLRIVGNHFTVNSNTIVIMAHGFTNNKSSNKGFDQLSVALNEVGYDALAIDFSGSGEIDDDALTSENQVDDLNSAIEFVLSKGYLKIALFGNSFGTLACIRSFRKEIETMILVGPLMDSMHYDWDKYFSNEQMNDLKQKGYFYTNMDSRHKITKQTLMDFEEVSQRDLVKTIGCPILILHGNNSQDEEELQLLKHSQKSIQLLPKSSKLEIIQGGKHGLQEHWDKVMKHSIHWYERQL